VLLTSPRVAWSARMCGTSPGRGAFTTGEHVQIQPADDKQPQLDALAMLLERPDVDAPTRRRIEQEIGQVRAGAAGERDAAYEIEFHSADNVNRVTIHDLQLEVGGRVAQIDHLLLNRLLDTWVLESKHFAEGVSINDHS
jgi:Nuclease-related domain